VAHEINNPLTALQLSVEALMSLPAGGSGNRSGVDSEAIFEDMLATVSSIAGVVRDLTIFSRADRADQAPRSLDVHQVIEQTLRLVGREIEVAGHVERDFEADLPRVVVPTGRLTQVLINVLMNAAHAIREVRRPVHRVRVSTRSDEEHVAISISDTGPGIPAHAVEHIFDPFFTTKRAGEGTGLGLGISRSLLRDIGGELIVESVHGVGATFVILLPLPSGEALSTAQPMLVRPGAPAAPPSRRVLVVEGSEPLLRAFRRLLGRTFQLVLAGDAQEAIDLLESGAGADAAVVDLSLPDQEAFRLLEWLRAEQPGLAERTVLVTSEQQLDGLPADFRGRTASTLLKPFDRAALLGSLAEVLADAEPGDAAPDR
jgi:CheY-like chemotaxis protein/anti-sigma regulatory factor (Ser/Thr protein kinase)